MGVCRQASVACLLASLVSCTLLVDTKNLADGNALTGDATTNSAEPRYSVGGSVSGLAGSGLVLENAGETLPITADGTFTFARKIATSGSYGVKVKAQPTSPTQGCVVENGAGKMGSSDVMNVAVLCSTDTFKVGGSLSGLAAGGTLVIQNNGGDALVLQKDGPFVFASPVLNGTPYEVSATVQPAKQSCTIQGGAGLVGRADVSNVAISCASVGYTLGGTATGAADPGLVLLVAPTGESLAIKGNGPFAFTSKVPGDSVYTVSVKGSPAHMSCQLENGTGTITADRTDLAVHCVYVETFDTVTAPALPGGWTASSGIGSPPPWITGTSTSDTAPNKVFAPDPSYRTDNRLTSPPFSIQTTGAQLSFRHSFLLDAGWDYGRLEISIAGGAFTDIVTAGGAFVSKPYTDAGNGWTAGSGGYITSVVNLPAAAVGKSTQLRWRLQTDETGGGAGWSVDSITLTP